MTSRAEKLLRSMSEDVSALQDYLHSHNLPELSIEEDVPFQFQTNPNFSTRRDSAIKACRELIALLSGSLGTLVNQTPHAIANTQAVCKFNIASNLTEDSDVTTYNELARRCRLPETEIRRIVRALIPSHVFREYSDGRVAHTAASKLLAVDPIMREWIDLSVTEMIPAVLKFPDAMEMWPGSEEPNRTGYSLAHDTQDMAFAHMAKFPGRSERFMAAMKLFSRAPENSPRYLVENYPWAAIGRGGVIVDIGGSSGEYSIPILQTFTNLQVIIQDLPEVIGKFDDRELPDNIKDRVSFTVHDFFTKQPVQGADVYLLRWILHDWSDTYAINILRALIPALHLKSKILINEHILPLPGEAPVPQEMALRTFDTSMRAFTNGKEREVSDWEDLIARADNRLKIEKIETPEGSALGIIVVGWEPSKEV
ncbi:S-adenosyl-L-methionine-dependent methyltransferase [Periconia macrospinosa]|uniref:S-adenosyl-L-methionine-dependent methyltransferase n=1 Tax=Periconia macrospinosa TaxID=97972 RepID=A0A2V1EFR7_9PLEO|nr:S-adenosyl-L-methionine-dependent methyltransferase [Periconia macrospinosa]